MNDPPGQGPGEIRSVVMEKILVVDDSTVQASRLKAILEGDYDVVVAQTAEDGLRLASRESFSLILLDVVMPGMDGFTLLKKLQEEVITQSVPVILITSLSDEEDEQHGLVLGAVDYIRKPFKPLIVKARVNTHIKLSRIGFMRLTKNARKRPHRNRSEKQNQAKIPPDIYRSCSCFLGLLFRFGC